MSISGSLWGREVPGSIKFVRGKRSELHWVMYIVSLAFLIYFAMEWMRKAFGV